MLPEFTNSVVQAQWSKAQAQGCVLHIDVNCEDFGSFFFIKFHHMLKRTDTIGRYDLVGVGVALLKEVCNWGWTLRSWNLQSGLV